MSDYILIKEFLQCRPVDEVSIRSAVDRLYKENLSLKAAIEINNINRMNYSGYITDRELLEVVCECGAVVQNARPRKISWYVIKDILKLIQKSAKAR